MTLFLLIILYIADGQRAVLEQKAYKTEEACMEAGQVKMLELFLSDKEVLLAGCAPIEGQEAKNERTR